MCNTDAGPSRNVSCQNVVARLSISSSSPLVIYCAMSMCSWFALCAGCGQGPPPSPKAADGLEALIKIVDSTPGPGEITQLHQLRRREAIEALGELGEPATATLLKVANDPEMLVRHAAIEQLVESAPLSKESAPGLIDLLQTSDAILIVEALGKTLEAMGDGAKEFVPLLSEAVTDKNIDYDIRRFVALRLLKIDREAAIKVGVQPRSDFAVGELLPEIEAK